MLLVALFLLDVAFGGAICTVSDCSDHRKALLLRFFDAGAANWTENAYTAEIAFQEAALVPVDADQGFENDCFSLCLNFFLLQF